MHYLQALPTLATVLVLGYMGFLVYNNSRDLTNRLFVAVVLSNSLWLVSVFLVTHTSVGVTNPLLGRFSFAISLALAVSIQMFAGVLLRIRHSKWYQLFLFGGGAAVALLTLCSDKIIKGVKIVHGLPYPDYGSLYPVFNGFLGVTVIVLLLFLSLRWLSLRKSPDVATKRQLNIVLVGLALFTGASLLTNLILPALLANALPSQFAPIGGLVLSICFFIAISRYRLFDIRTTVVRGTTYVSLIALLALGFVLTVNVASALFTPFRDDRNVQNAFNAVLALCVAIVFHPLKLIFNRVTNKYFFRDIYDPQDVLDRIGSVLVRSIDMNWLQNKSGEILLTALGAEQLDYLLTEAVSTTEFMDIKHLFGTAGRRSVIVLDEVIDHKEIVDRLKQKKIAVAVRLRTTHGELGYMCLGAKKSGGVYTMQDKRLLSTVADEVAISMQNALHFQEIQNFNQTLQERVRHATKELRRTNEKLKQLDETKDEFISMASHQLRTPLTSVKGYLSMVLEGDAGKISANQRKLLEQSYASSQRMVYLISDLLNLSRLNTGKFVIEPVPVDLSEVVQAEIEQLVETAKARELTLTYDRPATFPQLMLDETKIHQVVMNFIDNAIYYTPAGGSVTVELRETPTAVEYLVRDTGIGVPKAVQHKLFTKFYRAANAQQARPDGTGLGLFMAKKVVVAQGGSIIFESEEGRGSTFGFRFSKAGHMVTGVPQPVPQSPEKQASAVSTHA